MRAIRIWYKKSGHAVYISHLDLYRTMSRAIRRAQIPIWYTEGFNPKPYLNFLLPLPLGIEALCEPIDLKIDGEIQDDEIVKRLNDVLPTGLEILKASSAECSVNEVRFASYNISLELDSNENAESFAQECENLVASQSIIAEKMGKSGRRKVAKQINLCDNIEKFHAKAINVTVNIQAVLSAGNSANLNPFLLINAFKSYIETDLLHITISRTSLLKADFSNFE
ncbi:MAG TPA: TIGR03936 family radical SAM-associated protein [Clostridia bacterium]|nr:TIGR03936 family radical SAM-associated protein [Clostridia bacterium]